MDDRFFTTPLAPVTASLRSQDLSLPQPAKNAGFEHATPNNAMPLPFSSSQASMFPKPGSARNQVDAINRFTSFASNLEQSEVGSSAINLEKRVTGFEASNLRRMLNINYFGRRRQRPSFLIKKLLLRH
ncbi:MAG: hypothetical protein H7327_03445 [Herminiimonas sp.]|nr:hypothetical protein [Herminiimonas sp.]